MECVRRTVPNDNSCLFYAVAYLVEGADAVSEETQKELRRICAEAATADPDPVARALLLDSPVDEYAEWIQKPHNWGGEHEVVALANYYRRRVCVVSADATLCYGSAGPTVYILYTGTHYDPLVGLADGAETPQFLGGAGEAFEAAARAIAVAHREKTAKREASEVIYRIRCDGCGEKLVDSAAFQAHCGAVEHGDDFAYECEEIFEATYDEDDA
jgi:hypothetical protein